jgi:hypothetical protein
MSTVVVRTGAAFMDFRSREAAAGPMSFLPLDMAFDAIAPGPMDLPLDEGRHPGFLGYVVDLVELRPGQEHLRMSVVWALFKDLAVFSTEASALAAARSLGRPEPELFRCCLDVSAALPDPAVMIASGGGEWPARTGEGDHRALVEEARRTHLSALSALQRRRNIERRRGVARAARENGGVRGLG